MTLAPAQFGDTRVQFGDERIDWAGHWLDDSEPPVAAWILRSPTVLYSPMWHPARTREQRAENLLARYMPARVRELNVYRLVDGSYTSSQPWDANRIAQVWFGGHTNIVNEQDRDGLRGAGFTVDDLT